MLCLINTVGIKELYVTIVLLLLFVLTHFYKQISTLPLATALVENVGGLISILL